ncbi:MAG: RluA family pseudouridine synthase [Proteobacteria bacterium]|nr:RluA family pseudouridine synthase [Pseudomonadota bacterium]
MSTISGSLVVAAPDLIREKGENFCFSALPGEAGLRLDLFLVRHLPDYSRSALGKLIRGGYVRVEGRSLKSGYRIGAGERVEVVVPPPASTGMIPERIDFTVLFEDESLLVLVKPPGLVVHPAAGHSSGTLAHGLLYHCNSLPGMDEQRPGIVHRLDKDTSGIMLVAKTDKALRQLAEDFRERRVGKTYHALLLRRPHDLAGRIVSPIGRHPVNRQKMAVRNRGGRYAATRWRVIEYFTEGLCFVELVLETGRTHQIRVHMASLGSPVAGDQLYGGRVPEGKGLTISRQLLHASSIRFNHPETGESLFFTTPLWPDMQMILEQLRRQA